jgi:prepilin-type processing-associated H-X9-DG protein
MYSTDNNGQLVLNLTIDDNATWANTQSSWVRQAMRWSNTNDVTAPMLSPLSLFSPYLSGSLQVYKCPEDKYYTAAQKPLGWRTRPRSVGMNYVLSGFPNQTGTHTDNLEKYRLMRRDSDFRALGPADIYSMIDEHPDSHEGSNGAVFRPPGLQVRFWGGYPASWHGRGATLVFVDGHASIKKWRNATTVQPVLYELIGGDWVRGNYGLPVEDLTWVADRTSEHRSPPDWLPP